MTQAENTPPLILAVTSEPPWPLDTGGRLRTFHLLRSLGQGFRVRLVTPVLGGGAPVVEALEQHGIEVVPVSTGPRTLWRESLCATAAAARGEPYVMYRRHDRRSVRAAVRERIRRERPSIFYLDHLDSFLYRSLGPGIPCALDLHNVYSSLVERTAEEQSSAWRRRYLKREARLLARAEARAVRSADVVFAVSRDDARVFEAAGARGVNVIPNGVDCGKYQELPTERRGEAPVILFVGLMSWGPNAAAAEHLARTILPLVRARVPGARLRILGRDPAAAVVDLAQLPGVEVTGAVPDMIPHLREAHILAAPLQSGGGTRLKILEAFAAGLPVVSTPIGCEGLGAVAGTHLIIAERADFADAIASLLQDETRRIRLAEAARRLARERFDWSPIGDSARAALEPLVQAGR